MRHAAQEQRNCDTSAAGIMPFWLAWNTLFLIGIGFGLEVSGYSVIDVMKTFL